MKTNRHHTQSVRVAIGFDSVISSKLSELDTHGALASMREKLLDRATLIELDYVARGIALANCAVCGNVPHTSDCILRTLVS